MSQDFYSKAIREFPSHSLHIVPTDIAQKYTELVVGKQKIRTSARHRVLAQNRQQLSVQPSTTVPVSLLNGGQLEFRINKGVIDIIDYCMVKLNITNNSGGASVLTPSQFLAQRIDIYGDNGGVLLKQIYPLELYLENALLTRNEFENFSAALGLNASTYASLATSIANTATAELYIPIWQPFYPAKLHASALSGELIVRILFNPTALTHVSGSLVDVTDCKLLIKGRDQHNAVAAHIEQHYKSNIPLQLSFMNIQRTTQTLALAASTTYNLILSGIRGICSILFFTIRPAALTAGNILTFTAVQDYDIQNSDGSSINGFQRRNATEGLLDYAETFDNLFRKNVNFHCISFSTDPISDFTFGSNHGFQAFSSFEKLSFTTAAGLSSASYQVDVIAFCHDHLTVDMGRITATRS